MACSYGSEAKPGSPPTFIVAVGDVVCALYGQDSIMCKYASGGLGPIIPNAWVNTAEFCNGPPSTPDSLSITDFPTGWVSKAIDLAKSQKWNTYCQCKVKPTPPPSPGGSSYGCGVYQISGNYFQSSSGVRPGPAFSQSHIALSIQVYSAETSGEVYVDVYNCSNVKTTINNGFSKVTASGLTITKTGECQCQDDSEPPVIPPPPPPPPNLPEPPPPPYGGPPGPQGPPGPMGDCSQCPPGIKGDKGEQGIKGETGDIGPRGLPGLAGPQGDIGPIGSIGPTGPKGDSGFSGPTGPKGDVGPSGPAGAVGPQGPKGDVGPPGPIGPTGSPGPQGLPGKEGMVGPKGEDAVIEYEDYEFEIHDCVEGEEQISLAQLPVIRPDQGDSGMRMFQAIFDNVYNRTRELCSGPTANVEPAIIGSGVSSQLVPVFYIDIKPEVRSVILLITGDLPKGIKKYRLQGANEDECGFGNIGFATVAPNNSSAYESGQGISILTRATLYRIPPTKLAGKVRLSLWEYLTWTLYDSGER